ncbi:CPBP family intramembrane glutamic endopeptidase [Brevibacillus migulae]|uniref:CPBP family intramembrane glutamic endopeptidase n=1 Tax=Brevibacillus migulae TaxID=1644114 RepID=UPI00106EB973|nr:CPBP family intramembrane glutamic endopeptidase [Brevibacillus migulae]
MSDRLSQMDARSLRLNLLVTQSFLLLLGIIGTLWQVGWKGTGDYFLVFNGIAALAAIGIAVMIALLSIGLEHFLPPHWQDDGELSRKLFTGMSIPSTFLVCVYVGLSEEWLFRGAIQPLLGNGWTSLLFAAIHVRYLRKPILLGSVFGTSLLLGWLFQYSQGLLAPIIAHSLLDFFLALYIRREGQSERSE